MACFHAVFYIFFSHNLGILILAIIAHIRICLTLIFRSTYTANTHAQLMINFLNRILQSFHVELLLHFRYFILRPVQTIQHIFILPLKSHDLRVKFALIRKIIINLAMQFIDSCLMLFDPTL